MMAQLSVDTTGVQECGEEREPGMLYGIILRKVLSPTGGKDDQQKKVRVVRAGTVERLVEHLAPFREEVDVSYRACFLATFRTFLSPERVLQLLTERYAVMSPEPSDTGDQAEEKTAVQSAVLSFLRLWLESYPSDFCAPPSYPLLSSLHTFVQECGSHSSDLCRTAVALRSEFTQKALTKPCDAVLADTRPGYAGDTPFSLFTLSPEDFARALTAEDAYLFRQIVPHQCLSYIRKPKHSHAPSIRACIQHFNQVSFVVMATILTGSGGSEGRGRVMGRWVDVAEQCRLVKNFSSLKAIICAMESSAVYRLKRSWQTLPESKVTLFTELSELFTADQNYGISRDLLNREGTGKYPEVRRKSKMGRNGATRPSVSGVVPYLGTFLTDLTMLHTAHPDTTQNGFVNFEKHRREFEVLAQLTLYQKSALSYQLHHHPQLVQWLRETHTYTDQESYALSLELEGSDGGRGEEGTSEPNGPSLKSPQRSPFRKALRNLFVSIGTAVADSSLRRAPDHDTMLAPPSFPLRQSSSANNLLEEGAVTRSHERASSLSPSLSRRLPSSHAVRVMVCNENHCLYKSILVSETDKTPVVVRAALEKHGLPGSPSQYCLIVTNSNNRRVKLPDSAIVFYALSTSDDDQPTVLLERKDPKGATL